MNALATAATELQGRALMSRDGLWSLRTAVAGPLVGAIGAVDISVAGPQAWHANGVVTLEGRGAAGDGRARCLVAAIVAVCLVVAHEGGRHALTAPAAELGLWTLL